MPTIVNFKKQENSIFSDKDFSGDLTDAKNADMLGSQQYVEEWATYSDVLKNSGVLNKTTWLDIRGNHGKKYSCILHMKNIQKLCI